ncbi:death domain-containing immune deficiency protein isoform X2 [Rhynchophorus ferrugineus]|uniref:death domain-containing immune deficiency protein isoform X2 n=1 Tax=Rhynchophorus ferrugineus TaxID=354439 RepID=UPI003FCE2EBE
MSSQYTTDAMPSPPRGEPNENENQNKQPKENLEEPKKKQQISYPKYALNVVNINGSSHIVVGNQYTTYVNNTNLPNKNTVPTIAETKDIIALKASKKKLTKEDLQYLSKHMDQNWVWLARHFRYSTGQIDQFQYKYRDNLRETIYQFLLDWYRNTDEPSTVGELATALWLTSQQEAVKFWAQDYDAINNQAIKPLGMLLTTIQLTPLFKR